MKLQEINMKILLSKAEVKMIKNYILNIWQEYWDTAGTRRRLYSTQK